MMLEQVIETSKSVLYSDSVNGISELLTVINKKEGGHREPREQVNRTSLSSVCALIGVYYQSLLALHIVIL